MSYCDVYVCSFQYFVILYVFSYLVPCCGGRYDFRIKWLICSSLPLSFVWGIIFYLFCFVFSGIQHVLTERVTGDRNWLPFASTWVHHWLFGGVLVAHIFCFLLCFFLFCLSSSCVVHHAMPSCCQCLWIFHFRLSLWFSLTLFTVQ